MVRLPERPFQPGDSDLRPFPPAKISPPEPGEQLRPELRRRAMNQPSYKTRPVNRAVVDESGW